MRSRTMFPLFIIAASALILAASQPAIASDEDEVLKVVKNLYTVANESNADLASTLYCEPELYSVFNSNSFQAFLSQGNTPLDNWYQILREYPKGTFSFTFHNPKVTLLGNDVAVATGYAIRIVNPPLTPEQVTEQVRGTVILQKTNNQWLVVHEHYSKMPTE